MTLPWDELIWDHQELTSGRNTSFYAPYTSNPLDGCKGQAHRLKSALLDASARRALNSNWPGLFWQAVEQEKTTYGLFPLVSETLMAHGYHGSATVGAPREPCLSEAFGKIVHISGMPYGSGPSVEPLLPPISESFHGTVIPVHQKLPSDLQRAASVMPFSSKTT